MKIILYIILIAIVALAIYAIIVRISGIDFTGISDNVNSAFDNAANWIQDKIDYVLSYLTE